MPLVAINRSTGERIDVTVYDDPRSQVPVNGLMCPECKSPMMLKAGTIKIAHFAHKANSNCEYGQGETRQHLEGKRMIAAWLRKTMPKSKVELEYPIANRRADIAQIFPNGWIMVHEIQLASITVEKLWERTRDYMEAGCDSFWYFGERTATPANKQWAMDHQGRVLYLRFTEETNANPVDL